MGVKAKPDFDGYVIGGSLRHSDNPDFGGYATKAGLKCSDGRTIMPNAFAHQDTMTVPLVWQHGHSDPSNVLGHAVLENREDGVYAYGYFNDTSQGENAKTLVKHKDIVSLSIFANRLVEKAQNVMHGFIREVSLVLSGANPGALIDNIELAHSDGGETVTLDDEAIIYSGLELEHAAADDGADNANEPDDLTIQDVYDKMSTDQQNVVHYMVGAALEDGDSMPWTEEGDDPNDPKIQSLYDSMSDEQKAVVHFMVGAALEDDNTKPWVQQSDDDPTVKDVFDAMTQQQQEVVHYMVGAAIENTSNSTSAAEHSDDDDSGLSHDNDGKDERHMTRNVFEKDAAKAGATKPAEHTLSHDDMHGIMADAVRMGSLKEAVLGYALQHNIDNVDVLFPEFRTVGTPEFDTRRIEWVAGVIDGTRHSPFSRIKSMVADLTFEQARAKGYVKGNMKKEEFFGVSKRTTTPATIYKKQKLDRDDILDIVDFDVVVWLKAEMRLMLDEELARAILIGDGREPYDDDKIKDPAGSSEGAGIRSIMNDDDLYAADVFVNIDDTGSTPTEIVDAIVSGMRFYKGSGSPSFYTTIPMLTRLLLARDTVGRRLYRTASDLAAEMMVADIVTVAVMEDEPDLVGIVVNLTDYTVGADKGGDVSMFDFFDIDFNQYKYLIETRLSGALTKIRSALVIKKVVGTDVLTAPVSPTYDITSRVLTPPTTTGVVYKRADTNATVTTGAPITLGVGASLKIYAVPATGYYFASNEEDEWTFKDEV